MRTPEQIIGKDRFLQLVFEGYRVVPLKPTDAMLSAMCELECTDPVCLKNCGCRRDVSRMNRMQEHYENALRAKPE